MKSVSYLVILLGGALFGFGLAWSGMVRPEIVLSFLKLQDMGLMLVLGSAVTTTLLCYQLAPRFLKKPLLEEKFGQHACGDTPDTLTGAALFGIGWGLSGVCPGPAIAGLGTGNWPLLAVIAALFAGAWAQGWWASRNN